MRNCQRKSNAGQWVFLCIPKLGILHWHPFTISAAARDAELTLHFSCGGNWTRKVAELAASEGEVKVCS